VFLDSKTLCHCTCPEAEKAKKALSKKALKQMIWWKAGFVHLAWNSFLPIGFMVVSQFFTYFRIFPYFSFYRFLLNTLWQAAPETLQRLGQSNMSADYFL